MASVFRAKPFMDSIPVFTKENGTPTFSDKPRCVTFNYPGLSAMMTDRELKPSLFDIMKMAMSVKFMGRVAQDVHNGNRTLCNWTEATEGVITPMACTRVEMSRAIYSNHVLNMPMKIVLSVGSVGATSITEAVECLTRDTNAPLMKQTARAVRIDPETRKPKAFPEWFRNDLAGKGSMEGQQLRIKKFNRPPNTFLQKTQVTVLDTDKNKHTTNHAYVKFAVDAVGKAILYVEDRSRQQSYHKDDTASTNNERKIHTGSSEKIGNSQNVFGSENTSESMVSSQNIIPSEIARTDIKEANVLYLRQSSENDMLNVYAWYHGEFQVRCSIEKEAGHVCCQVGLEYYPPLSKI